MKNKTNSRIIEKSIYNYIIKLSKQKNIQRSWNDDVFKNLYLTKCRSIYANLDSTSYIKNKNFLKNINSGKIDISNIANISIYDIFPENWKEILELKHGSSGTVNAGLRHITMRQSDGTFIGLVNGDPVTYGTFTGFHMSQNNLTDAQITGSWTGFLQRPPAFHRVSVV